MHLHCDVCIYYYQYGGFPRHVALYGPWPVGHGPWPMAMKTFRGERCEQFRQTKQNRRGHMHTHTHTHTHTRVEKLIVSVGFRRLWVHLRTCYRVQKGFYFVCIFSEPKSQSAHHPAHPPDRQLDHQIENSRSHSQCPFWFTRKCFSFQVSAHQQSKAQDHLDVQLTHGPRMVLWWLLCVCAADPWAHGFCGGCCVSVCAADPWAQVLWWLCVCAADPWAHAGSVVAVVCVCVGVRLTHGPTLVLGAAKGGHFREGGS